MPFDCSSSGLTKWAWGLTHAIMEVEKTQDLLSSGYKPRRADGVSSSWKAEDAQCPSSAVRTAGFALTVFVFYSVFSWPHEAHPHWGGRSALLSLPIQMLISFRNTLTDTPGIMFNQMSGYPVVQPGWHITSTVIPSWEHWVPHMDLCDFCYA